MENQEFNNDVNTAIDLMNLIKNMIKDKNSKGLDTIENNQTTNSLSDNQIGNSTKSANSKSESLNSQIKSEIENSSGNILKVSKLSSNVIQHSNTKLPNSTDYSNGSAASEPLNMIKPSNKTINSGNLSRKRLNEKSDLNDLNFNKLAKLSSNASDQHKILPANTITTSNSKFVTLNDLFKSNNFENRKTEKLENTLNQKPLAQQPANKEQNSNSQMNLEKFNHQQADQQSINQQKNYQQFNYNQNTQQINEQIPDSQINFEQLKHQTTTNHFLNNYQKFFNRGFNLIPVFDQPLPIQKLTSEPLINQSINCLTSTNSPSIYQSTNYVSNQKPINYSDIDSQDTSNDSYLSDVEFEFYYGDKNLYMFNSRKYFNNLKYRIIVKRYGNDIRVFKPICIVKETNKILFRILGTYCLNVFGLVRTHLPLDFIYPLNSNKHEENVETIRKIIQNNPVDDELPYIGLEESLNLSKPFRLKCLNQDSLENQLYSNILELSTEDTINGEYNNKKLNVNQNGGNNNEIALDGSSSLNSNDVDLNSNLINVNSKNTEINANEINLNKKIISGNQKKKQFKMHCPYCFQQLSSISRVKNHYKPRKNGQGTTTITCKIKRQSEDEEFYLDPILCDVNCKVCLEKNKN